MRRGTRRRQWGKGKFEFAVAVALIGVLAAVLMNRLVAVEEETERVEVGLTIRNMRTGLQLAVGERIMRGEEDALAELLDRDPVSFLNHRPQGYLDSADKPGGAGVWWYDRQNRTLSYRPRQPAAFGGQDELRWRMRGFPGAGGRVVGLRIEADGGG